ncbi:MULTISPECIES: YpfB family protein [unclassified Bacillus (in: firmicutes)]|uniref:YpfB family protein n=1 Tax=unclassified Bacillus (in: firmicutes) TaxID=185979 RepID=UPI0022827C5B|nr:YpfB family protein [Bacillus sp. S20C3]MCY8203325.1 YpfB family protein [Bacillus sp. N12A5]MCY8290069.1 YpfB family protein [Bacillus sp. N13C7]MCY8637473.1 YpfB family protein [Bacillus sp. S17B2]MCY8719654.1 YpfB family protein [Bacillus sp. S10C12M]MCY9145208.1 YpfB family protein [Bacillus sp. T9C1]
MKTFERLLIKLLFIQAIILLGVQFLFHYQHIEPYVSKVIQYEGVDKMKGNDRIETFKH